MKIHEYNEMMAYLTRPGKKHGGVIGEGGMFQGENMGYRTGFKKLKTPYDHKYSGVYKIKTGENKGQYTFEVRNPNYTGKGSKEPARIKIGPFDNETAAIKAYQERQKIMGEIKLAGPQAKVTEQTKAINNFVTDFYEKNLNKFKLRDYQSFEKKLLEEFEKTGIKDLGSQRKALNFGFPNVGKHAGKKASKTPLTLYGMDARTPSGLNLQTDAQSFFKKAFYSGKLKNNPELVGKLRRYLEYYNADRSKGKYYALKAKYADVLDPKVKSDLIYFLESDQIGTGKLRSSVIKQYLPDEYDTYVKKKNASGIRYNELMKKIENSLIEKGYKKQLKQALNETTSIRSFMSNQTNLLNKIFDTSELKKAGYSELIFNADHLEGIAEIAQMDNADDQIRALRNLVGTTSEINRELGLEGFSSKRKSLMQKIKNGTNVEANMDELNKITNAAYPQFKGKLYQYDSLKGAVPTKNFTFNYDPETAFRQYFNELVKNPVGSEILTKQYLDKPELQKVIQKDPNLLSKINAELRTLLNSADKPTIMKIRKALKCPSPKSSGGRVGLATGSGNLLDCPMAKFAQNPEGTLNKVGQTMPETRTPITNMFKKLGTPLKWAGNTFNVGLGPTGIIGLNYLLDIDPTKTADRIGLEAEAALAPTLVKGATSVTDKIKTPALRKIAERATLAGMSPAMALRLARIGQPIGWLSLGAEGLYQAGKKTLEDPGGTTMQKIDALKQAKEDYYEEGEHYNQGGRVGFNKGSPKSPGRRTFLKGITALAALPIVGKFFKMGKVLEKAQPYTGPAIEKIKGMPEWFPGLVKKLWNEGEDVTEAMAYKERVIVKRGTLEGGDDVDMFYDLDTGDVNIEVVGNRKSGIYKSGETSSGAYNKEYSLEYKKGQADETTKGKKPPDEFGVNELEGRTTPDAADIDWDVNMTTVDDAMSDLTELEAFAKNKTTTQIHKQKGTKPKDVFPDYDPGDYDDYDID